MTSWRADGVSPGDDAYRRSLLTLLTSPADGDLDRHDGAVRVHLATVDHLKGYETITKAAPIVQTPTVLVIDKNAQAHRIEGLTVTREIDDLVDRALKVKQTS